MNPLRHFEEFLKEGMVKKQSPNFPRARALIEEAEKRKAFLDEAIGKLGISDENANYFIETAYDIIMELVRAKLLQDGFNISGAYAHEAEVAYLRNLKFPESDVRLANELRYFRNGIIYYGKRFDADYANKVIDFLSNIYLKLKQILKV